MVILTTQRKALLKLWYISFKVRAAHSLIELHPLLAHSQPAVQLEFLLPFTHACSHPVVSYPCLLSPPQGLHQALLASVACSGA